MPASSRFPSLGAPFQGPPTHLSYIAQGAKYACGEAAAHLRNWRVSARVSTFGRARLVSPLSRLRAGWAPQDRQSRDEEPLRQAATILCFDTRGQGFYPITPALERFVAEQRMKTGLLTIFCRHTSASLLIQENADPSVLRDLQKFLERLAPEDSALYEHDSEGLDDMPAHLRVALTQTQLALPVIGGALALGTWQGVFLIEHRRRPHRREAALHLIGE
jgi:secondary thiamine-phosphate synthase enzyme